MKLLIGFSFILFFLTACKKHEVLMPGERNKNQIIADHSIICDFEKIPPVYIEKVRKMIVAFPGESHSEAYREGLLLLQADWPELNCSILSGGDTVPGYLRIYQGQSVGEAQWFTWNAWDKNNRPRESLYIKDLIETHAENNRPINVIGFAWCWDAFARRSRIRLNLDRLLGKVCFRRDPEFGVYWFGASAGGPDGNREWGLDSTDYKYTGNHVSLATYLETTEEYDRFCRERGYVTRVIFTTGPADNITGESGYQGYLKHQAIRKFVYADSSRILFDYNDILCHDDDGNITTTKWCGHEYPVIAPANLGDGSIGHIGSNGAIRLAKAQWWLLARIAGWDGH